MFDKPSNGTHDKKGGKNIGRTVSWVYYKDEKLIGGSAFDIQLFRQILENNAKFSNQAQEMIETQIKEQNIFDCISLKSSKYTNRFYESGGHRAFIPESICMVDYCEDEIFAVVRIGDRCEIVSYDYDITGEAGQEWFNFIGKNKPIFDKKIIENIKTVLTQYEQLQIKILEEEDRRIWEKKEKLACRNKSLPADTEQTFLSLCKLLGISPQKAKKIYHTALEQEDICVSLINDFIDLNYLAMFDWKADVGDIVYGYNLLAKKIKANMLRLDKDTEFEPPEVFRRLAAMSDKVLYLIDTNSDCYILGLSDKENKEKIISAYKQLFSLLQSENTIEIVNTL
ncbi:hypothetical protein E4N90_10620 [Treponema denticola]|nr:hypothetical protein E4N90_10620 [Treponema denticola]